MNLYMKQRFFSWNDRFSIYDEAGNERYFVEGEIFSWGKKLHVYDANGNEVSFIQQKVWSFLPRYMIYRGETEVAQVVKEFTFFHQEYSVEGLGWRVHGDIWDHEYEIGMSDRSVAAVSKEWFTFGDAYRIWVSSEADEVMALSVVLVIDACIEAERNN